MKVWLVDRVFTAITSQPGKGREKQALNRPGGKSMGLKMKETTIKTYPYQKTLCLWRQLYTNNYLTCQVNVTGRVAQFQKVQFTQHVKMAILE